MNFNTSPMAHFSGLIKSSSDIPIVSQLYVSTEGIIGVACEWPEDGQARYVSLPNNLFYEFIPASQW